MTKSQSFTRQVQLLSTTIKYSIRHKFEIITLSQQVFDCLTVSLVKVGSDWIC